ncbi:MAG: IS200/IS605 family transposase [Deltaproteobacteria bacterium]|nr:IS200/IS605 family transposase [Deltaproteobacteria bacterium]
MAGTFTFLGIHFIFSTKNRVPLIDKEFQGQLHQYIGGTVRGLKGKLIAVNSIPDHIHLYTTMPKTISVSKYMEIIKSASSKWIHQTFSDKKQFAWQEGYGAFSVSKSNETKVVEYIAQQEQHHHKKSFQEEFLEFLKANDIEYDEKYIWK